MTTYINAETLEMVGADDGAALAENVTHGGSTLFRLSLAGYRRALARLGDLERDCAAGRLSWEAHGLYVERMAAIHEAAIREGFILRRARHDQR